MGEPSRARDERPVDAFGRAVWEWSAGGRRPEVIERDDGYFEEGAGPEVYLSSPAGWPRAERRAVRDITGRVLDLGCGAGRVALELQRRGHDVVGLDASRWAVRAARARGVHQVWHRSLDEIGGAIAEFDAVVLFGNNFGLFSSPEGARHHLGEWARSARADARVFLESTSAYAGGAPGIDRRYYRRNRALGRPGGELRARYHYDDAVGEWFTWLFVSRRELRAIVRGTGWRIERIYNGRADEPYVAVLTLASSTP